MDLLVEIGSWVGTVTLLAACALLSRGVLDGRGARYQTLTALLRIPG